MKGSQGHEAGQAGAALHPLDGALPVDNNHLERQIKLNGLEG